MNNGVAECTTLAENMPSEVDPHRIINGIVPHRPAFREWAPLKHLIEKIPPKYHHGFVSKDLALTCIAVSCDSIVLGSSAGVIFWFNRSNQQANRKSIDDKFVPVTSLAIAISEYGEALAVGNTKGAVAVFPSNPSQPTPVSVMSNEHGAPITAICWDCSGLRLLSGDESGKVLLSHFQHGALQSMKEIITEANSAIIQLRFHPLEHGMVLISSLRRVLIADISGTPDSVVQVGQKDRKYPTPFGADFGYAGNETVVYSSRPGLRLWLSDCGGTVRQTLIYKDSLAASARSRLNLVSLREDGLPSSGELHFGRVFCLTNGLVTTYSPTSVFILDPGQQTASQTDQISVFGFSHFHSKTTIRQATAFHNEIFLLTENRVLIRISDRPDRFSAPRSSTTIERPFFAGWDITKSVKPTFQSTISKLANKISDVELSSMTKTRPIASLNQGPYIMESLSNAFAPLFEFKSTVPIQRSAPPKPFQPQFSSGGTRSPSPIASTERCSPLPEANESLHVSASEIKEVNGQSSPAFQNGSPLSNTSSEGLAQSGDRDEELVYGSYIGKKRKWKLNRSNKLGSSIHEEVVMTEQLVPSQSDATSSAWTAPSAGPLVEQDDLLMRELERKDQLLATLLQLDQAGEELQDHQEAPVPDPLSERAETDVITPLSSSPIPTNFPEAEEEKEEEAEEPSEDDIYSKYAADVDSLETNVPQQQRISAIPDPVSAVIPETLIHHEENMTPTSWLICPLDAKRKLTSISCCRHYVAAIDGHKFVYYQSTESSFQARDWLPIDTPASQVVSAGPKLWRIFKNVAYQGVCANTYGPFAESWTTVESSVSSLSVVQLDDGDETEDFVWMLHLNGVLSCRPAACFDAVVQVDIPGSVNQLCSQGSRVLILLHNGGIYSRSRVTSQSPTGVGWQRLHAPGDVISMALSPHQQLWILTRAEQLFYLHADEGTRPRWWQVPLPANLRLAHHSSKWLNISSIFKRQSSEFILALTETRIFLALAGSSVLLTAQNVTGYAWQSVSINNNQGEKWRVLNANGMSSADHDTLWLMDDRNLLYSYHERKLEQVALPTEEAIERLTVTADHLWLVTEEGNVFIRVTGSNSAGAGGNGWVNLSTLQFQTSQLRRISLGSDLAWACDDHGRIYFRSGDNGPPTLLSPAWIAVDEGGISCKEIYVGPSRSVDRQPVWALDEDGKPYARQGITREFPVGTWWMEVEGVQAVQLSISLSAVWALSACGSIYRRTLHATPSVWEQVPDIPGAFITSLTVTEDDTLFTLDTEGAVYQLTRSAPLKNADGGQRPRQETLHVDDDWVLL